MGGLSWIILVGPKCDHKGPSKERQEDQKREKAPVTMVAEVGVLQPEAQAKECRQPLEAGSDKEQNPPPGASRRKQPRSYLDL